MNFGDALQLMRAGAGYTREVWKDPRKYVTYEDGELVIYTERDAFGGPSVAKPWKAASGDMVAEDWYKVKDAPQAEEPTPQPRYDEPKEESGSDNG